MRRLRGGSWRWPPVCLVAMLLLVAGCKEHAVEKAPASALTDEDLKVSPAGYHTRHASGPAYLPRSSPVDDGTTVYDVVYQKGVTVVSKDDWKRHLVAIQTDGGYSFDAKATQIARLQEDSIVILSGLAVRTVVGVEKSAGGYLLKTSPAKITDAIKRGRLEGTYKVNFSSVRRSAEFDVNFANYNYHVEFTPVNDHIHLRATIKFAGSDGTLAYAAVGDLSNFVTTIRMQIKDGEVTNLDFLNNNLTGQMNLKWYAVASNTMRAGSMAKITSWPAELFKNAALANVGYDVPIILGALPLDLRISLGFSFIPDLGAKNSTVAGSKLIQFAGSGGFQLVSGQTKPGGSFTVDAHVDPGDSRVEARGPVGFTAATEAPRLDLALGWPPGSPALAGYLNFVTSYGIVTNDQASARPCQTNIMAFSVNAGAAYSSPNTFATWAGTEAGTASSVSLWSKTFKSAGMHAGMCPG